MDDKTLLELAAKAAEFDDAEWDAITKSIKTARLQGLRCWLSNAQALQKDYNKLDAERTELIAAAKRANKEQPK